MLVTKPDFYNEETRRHLISTLSELISLNIVPIINTNDAVSPPPQADDDVIKKGNKVRVFLSKFNLYLALLGLIFCIHDHTTFLF